jgi:hypothetical protein
VAGQPIVIGLCWTRPSPSPSTAIIIRRNNSVIFVHPKRRYAIVLALVVFASALALFGRAFFLGETFAERDLYSYYYAAKWLLAPLARASGDIPLWNPFFASGQPFAANPENELFHPLTSLFFLLPFDWAFRLQVILPPLVAIPCMFWFLRVLRRSRPAALFGAIAWGLGGFLLSATNVLPFLFASAPLPLTLGFAIRILRAPSRIHAVGFALSFALQCLTGEPISILATLLLLVAAGWSQRKTSNVQAWSIVAACGCLGLLVAAVVLVPGAHHASQTIRAAGLTDSMANEWSMPAVRAVELLSPHILGHVDRSHVDRFWGSGLYGVKIFPYYYSLYPGLAVGLLALLAWTTLGRRRLWPWAMVALLGYATALGDHFVMWPLLRQVPGLSGVRYAEKAMVVVVLATVVAASHGFDWFVVAHRRRRSVVAGLSVVAIAGLAVAVMLLLGRQTFSGAVVSDGIPDACRVAVLALILMVALRLSRGWRRELRGLLLCVLLLLDLLGVGRELLPTVPASSLSTPPQFLAPVLQSSRDELVFHLAEWHPSFSETGGLAKPPLPARWGLAMTLERDFDFTQLRWTYDATMAWLEVAKARPELAEPMLSRRGVTAIVHFVDGAHWQSDRLVGPGGGPAVETLVARQPKPFAFAATRVERVQGVSGWKARVSQLGAAAGDTVCVEDDQMEPLQLPPSPAEITVTRTSPMAFGIDVSVAGPGPAFVAINQTWHPGWRTHVDGAQARLIRTDLALSGVLVPPGKHRVQLAYDDPWLRAGFAISLLSVLACLAIVVGPRVWSQHRSSSRV